MADDPLNVAEDCAICLASKDRLSSHISKEVRNTNEHFDERYEEFGGNLGDDNLLDNNTDPYMRAVIKANPHLRTYDKENHIYYTFVRSKGEFKRAEYNLDELQSELEKMMHRISENSLFDSAWVTEISTESVE